LQPQHTVVLLPGIFFASTSAAERVTAVDAFLPYLARDILPFTRGLKRRKAYLTATCESLASLRYCNQRGFQSALRKAVEKSVVIKNGNRNFWR